MKIFQAILGRDFDNFLSVLKMPAEGCKFATIGDVQGSYLQLRDLVTQLSGRRLIFLGDLVGGQGEEPLKVFTLIMLLTKVGFAVVCRGNHDDHLERQVRKYVDALYAGAEPLEFNGTHQLFFDQLLPHIQNDSSFLEEFNAEVQSFFEHMKDYWVLRGDLGDPKFFAHAAFSHEMIKALNGGLTKLEADGRLQWGSLSNRLVRANVLGIPLDEPRMERPDEATMAADSFDDPAVEKAVRYWKGYEFRRDYRSAPRKGWVYLGHTHQKKRPVIDEENHTVLLDTGAGCDSAGFGPLTAALLDADGDLQATVAEDGFMQF